jgi:hypothetical protein
MSQDATLATTGALTISSGVVTLGKMANLAANSFIGNNTGSAATPIALSVTQATAMLNLFSTSAKGLVPATGGVGATYYLNATGSWSVPAGGGGGSGTVTSASQYSVPYYSVSPTGTTVIATGTALALIVIGFFVGALAGMLGIGGGLITVPIMIIIFHVPPAVAKGTALAVVIPTALSGTIQNLANKNSDLLAALMVSMTGIFSAIAGGWVAAQMSAGLSNFLFAVLLMTIAGRMLLQLRKQREVTPVGE